MNILIFSWRGPKHPNAGGAEISTHEHAKGWVKAGHNVTLFTSSFLDGKKEEIIDGVNIIRDGKQIFGVQWEALKWYLFGDHPKYDLVIDQFHGIPFFTPLYVRVKKLAFIHEVTKEVWGMNYLPRPFNIIPALMGPFFEPFMFKIFYSQIPFMTVSESTKSDLIEWGIPKENITIINNGVTIPKNIEVQPKEETKTLVYLGAISKDKGIEDALKIFSIINSREKDWQFWVIGKSDINYMKFLKNLIESLNLKGKVKFWGFVDEKRKFELLSRAHLLINPSIREGWGLVVIEAASMGTPTVGYNVPGLRDSINDDITGLLSNPNPIACSESILSLMSDQNKYKKLRQNCFKWSKKFSWKKSAKASLELIERLSKDH